MLNKHDMLNGMDQFIGTEHYYRFNPLTPKTLLTDGAKWLAENGECWWLMTMIASHLPAIPEEERFVVIRLRKADDKWHFAIVDDIPTRTTYATQDFEYSDFPLSEVKLYAQRHNGGWVIMLTSEY